MFEIFSNTSVEFCFQRKVTWYAFDSTLTFVVFSLILHKHFEYAMIILVVWINQYIYWFGLNRIREAFKVSQQDSYSVKFGKNIVSGGAAGALSLSLVYSLDYARTRLAANIKSAADSGVKGNPNGERQFNGLIDVYKKTYASDGIKGLYRGFVISCVGIIVYRGYYFGLFDTIKPMIDPNASFIVSFGIGYGVTVFAGLASYPIDTVRRRMMMKSGEDVKYKGSIDCAIQMWKHEGIKSFFKGATANILRGMAGAGTLAGFDVFTKLYANKKYGSEQD